MTPTTPGGLVALGGSPHVTVSTTDNYGVGVIVYTSVLEHTTEAERRAIAEAQHLSPAPHDYNVQDMGTLC